MDKRILLIEDDQILSRLVAQQLRSLGHEVTQVGGWKDADAYLAAHEPHLIITDVKLPDGDSLERLPALVGAQPVIILTAYGSVRDAVAAMKAGAYEYLLKPVSPEELTLVVGRALDDADLRSDHQFCAKRLKAQEGCAKLHDRGQRPADAGQGDHLRGGQQRHHGPDPGRERGGQGTGGARHPRPQPAGRRATSSPWTAAPCKRSSSSPNSSATNAGPSPGRTSRSAASSRGPRAAPCSWTRSARSSPPSRPSSCASWRPGPSAASAAPATSRPMCASSPPPIATWRPWARPGPSAPTSTIA